MSLIRKFADRLRTKVIRKQFGEGRFTANKKWPDEPPSDQLIAAARVEGLDLDTAARKNGQPISVLVTAIWDEGVNRQFIHQVTKGEEISLMDGFREVARECAERFPLAVKT